VANNKLFTEEQISQNTDALEERRARQGHLPRIRRFADDYLLAKTIAA
jgi:hypothetical protein